MQNFKELVLWKEAHGFTLQIYTATGKFPKEELFGLTSQIRRATVSIAANIAEGCGRHSSKDFAHFLQISLGSINETDYMILLAKDLNYISENQFTDLAEKANKLRAMSIRLIEKVRKNA